MKRQIHKFTAREVASLERAGWHSDGGGLYCRIGRDGRKAWVFVYHSNGRRREVGLGAASGAWAVSLSAAREDATKLRAIVKDGRCPLDEKRAAQAAAIAAEAAAAAAAVPKRTFGEEADALLVAKRPKWKSAVHARAWELGLRVKAEVIRSLPVDAVGVNEVLSVLEPVFTATPETGRRLRFMLGAVLDAAAARGHRTGLNPARWKGNLEAVLSAPAAHQRKHHAALPYKDMPAFMAQLREQEGIAAKALEFTILSAARSGETRQATWAQIDLQNGIWTVPAIAMKSNKEHRVPLSGRALEILRELAAVRVSDYVFPSYGGRALSTNAMLSVLERMKRSEITVHGFRSSFRDFAGEVSNSPHEVCEMALAHTIRNKAEAAYRRGDMLEKRRALMEQWATWCEPRPADNVVPLRGTTSVA
jgi:integrase